MASEDPQRHADQESDGGAMRRAALGPKSDEFSRYYRTTVDRGLGDWADDFMFGTVWARPGLSVEERSLLAIGVLAAMGETEFMKNYAHGALRAGTSPLKIHETVVQCVLYAGFPAAFKATKAWRDVLDSAVRSGVVDAAAASLIGDLEPQESGLADRVGSHG